MDVKPDSPTHLSDHAECRDISSLTVWMSANIALPMYQVKCCASICLVTINECMSCIPKRLLVMPFMLDNILISYWTRYSVSGAINVLGVHSLFHLWKMMSKISMKQVFFYLYYHHMSVDSTNDPSKSFSDCLSIVWVRHNDDCRVIIYEHSIHYLVHHPLHVIFSLSVNLNICNLMSACVHHLYPPRCSVIIHDVNMIFCMVFAIYLVHSLIYIFYWTGCKLEYCICNSMSTCVDIEWLNDQI